MAFTNGRNNVLPAITNSVSAVDCAIMSAPAQHPTAADAHKVPAVLRPRTFIPSFMIAPAPKNPMPDTTYAITRTLPPAPSTWSPRSTKAAAPTDTRTLVRRPALLCRYWRSAPITRQRQTPRTNLRGCRRNRKVERSVGIASNHLIRANISIGLAKRIKACAAAVGLGPMPQLGQSRQFDAAPTTSGPPQSTDIARRARLVRFVPNRKLMHRSDDHCHLVTSRRRR